MIAGTLFWIACIVASFCLAYGMGTWFIFLFDLYIFWGIWYAYRKMNVK